MAKLYPPVIDPDTPSPGERSLFERLRYEPATAGWSALHSLDLARHPNQVKGEADFVLLVPGKGVLCLEVKGCQSLRLEQGTWYYGQQQRGDSRGPFKQAYRALQAIKQRLDETRPGLSQRMLIWHAVLFPFVTAKFASAEWNEWEWLSADEWERLPLDQLFGRVLDRAREHLASKGVYPGAPTAAECEQVVQLLRPHFEVNESPRRRAERREEELKRYTSEQFRALDMLEDHPQAIFRGPAGSGKTFLAVEAARRAVLQGRRPLVLCYNRLIGEWLQQELAPLGERVRVGTFHHFCQSQVGPMRQDGPDFFTERLPKAAWERLACLEDGDRFDELIIDEAQDLLRPLFLDVLDASLKGGLKQGRWRFFGDFANQRVQESATLTLDQARVSWLNGALPLKLSVNCRNTRRTVWTVEQLTQPVDRYSQVLRTQDYGDPVFQAYAVPSGQEKLLCNVLTELYDDYRPEDIVILSTTERGIASQITTAPWRDRIRPFAHGLKGYVRHSTIRTFKGLESPVVIITDVQGVERPEVQDLLYVAMTRAQERVILLCHETSTPAILRAL